MTNESTIATAPSARALSASSRRTSHPHLPRAIKRAAALAVLIALLAWGALLVDGVRVVGRGLARGDSLPQALFLWFRFFTILTNIGVALLMTVTAVRLYRRRPPPSAAWHAAALVYILVVCATYESILRTSWVPHDGIGFDTDLVFHDIVPALMLVFWVGFAPKRGLGQRFALVLLIYPSLYFVGTLVAGALGEPYTYFFLDAGKLGYPTVQVVGLLFMAMYYALGLATITASRRKRLARTSDIYEGVHAVQSRSYS